LSLSGAPSQLTASPSRSSGRPRRACPQRCAGFAGERRSAIFAGSVGAPSIQEGEVIMRRQGQFPETSKDGTTPAEDAPRAVICAGTMDCNMSAQLPAIGALRLIGNGWISPFSIHNARIRPHENSRRYFGFIVRPIIRGHKQAGAHIAIKVSAGGVALLSANVPSGRTRVRPVPACRIAQWGVQSQITGCSKRDQGSTLQHPVPSTMVAARSGRPFPVKGARTCDAGAKGVFRSGTGLWQNCFAHSAAQP